MIDSGVEKKIDNLMSLFKEASKSIKEEDSLSEQLKEINNKLNTIAEALVAVSDMIKEKDQKPVEPRMIQKQHIPQRLMPIQPQPAQLQPNPMPVQPRQMPQPLKRDFSLPSLEPGQLPPLPPIGPTGRHDLGDLERLPPLPKKKRAFFR